MRALAVGLIALAATPARASDDREALAEALVAAADEPGRAAVRERARALILERLDAEIFPAWMGTPWGMGPGSTARRPHQPGRTIGCSAFVVAALEDAGLIFAGRSRFIQARALRIQRALSPVIHRFVDLPADRLAAAIAELGDGIYLIGLCKHIGFVRVRGETVELIHAGRTGPSAVQRELLELSPPVIASRPSGYFVSPVLTDEVIDRWLLRKPLQLP